MKLSDFKNELNNRHLNLDKILKLNPEQSQKILNLFDTFRNSVSNEFCHGGKGLNMSVDPSVIIMYNTLIEYDYLVSRREKNLDKILE